jgi:hypothetical protein
VVILGPDDVAALDFHRDLGQRPHCRVCNYHGTIGWIEDLAPARAGELAAFGSHFAGLVGADRRIRNEFPVFQVDQDSGIPRILERERTPGRNLGLARDSRPVRLGTTAR